MATYDFPQMVVVDVKNLASQLFEEPGVLAFSPILVVIDYLCRSFYVT